MADFKRAFSEGLKASTDAERAKAEILEVLGKFAEAVGEASGGVVEVKVGKDLEQGIDAAVAWLDPHAKIRSRDVVFASRVDARNDSPMELCEYELATFGYPVTLTYGENDVVCEDKVSLEEELARLLSAPATGTKLRRLMQEGGGKSAGGGKGASMSSAQVAATRPKRSAAPKAAGTPRRH